MVGSGGISDGVRGVGDGGVVGSGVFRWGF